MSIKIIKIFYKSKLNNFKIKKEQINFKSLISCRFSCILSCGEDYFCIFFYVKEKVIKSTTVL